MLCRGSFKGRSERAVQSDARITALSPWTTPHTGENGHEPLQRTARRQDLQLRQGRRLVEICSEIGFGLRHDCKEYHAGSSIQCTLRAKSSR